MTLDVLRRRNRLRIVRRPSSSRTLFYWLAVCAAAITFGLLLVPRVVVEGATFPTARRPEDHSGSCIAVVIVIAVILGSIVAAFTFPAAAARLERRVLAETGAMRRRRRERGAPSRPQPPRSARDRRPHPACRGSRWWSTRRRTRSRSGTRPKQGHRRGDPGAIDTLSRDELEAILAYEVSRIGSFGRRAHRAGPSRSPARPCRKSTTTAFARASSACCRTRRRCWLQRWALRDSAGARDRAAVRSPATRRRSSTRSRCCGTINTRSSR